VKTCKDCKKTKLLSDFHFRKDSENYRPACKECWSTQCEARRQTNLVRDAKVKSAYYFANKEFMRNNNELWKAAHPKEMTQYKRKWKKSNRFAVNAAWMKRFAAKLSQTPAWLTPEQLKEMEAIYESCPQGYHVDHIIPLQGKDVRGLHVPWNLQHLPASENIKKGNRVNK